MKPQIRRWGRPVKEVDESRGRPTATAAKDTFDDIAIQLEKNNFRDP